MKTKPMGTLIMALLLLYGCSGPASPASNSQSDLKMEAASDSGAVRESSAGDAADAPSEEMTDTSEWSEPGDNSSMIVYTADLTLQTRDYKKTWSEIKELISRCGGYIVLENLSNRSVYEFSETEEGEQNDQASSGFYSLKIPAEKLDSFLDAVAETENVISQSKNADNISKRYNDTKDQIEFLEKQNKRLLELLDQAENLSDVLAIEEKQMEVEQQLKGYNEQLSNLNQDIEYSTVYLSIDRVDILSPDKTGFGSQLSYALRNTWMYLVRGLGLIVLAMIYLLPWILLAALLFFIMRYFIRKSRNRKTAKKTVGKEQDGLSGTEDFELPIPNQSDQKEKRH